MGGNAFIEEFYKIEGVRVQVRTLGEGEPLLWLHGSGSNNPVNPVVSELAKHYKVYVPSHPGFNGSDRPDWLLDYSDYNYFYRSFLDYFQIDRAVVIGHSMGGRIAVEFAVSHTHRVKKLVLISPAGIHEEGLKRPDPFILTPEQRTRLLFHDEKLAEQALTRTLSPEEQNYAAKNLVTLARLNWECYYNPKFPRLLNYITVPTCIISGENDRMIPAGYSQAYHKHIPGSQLHLIPECGHIPMVEQPAKCYEIIANFLR
mgnify:CR=1 FL=1